MRLCRLRLPCRHGTRVHAIANTRDNATDNEMRQTKRGGLQDRAGGHGHAAQEDGSPAAQWITDEDREDRSTEAPQIVGCDCDATVRRALRLRRQILIDSRVIGVDLREVFDKRRQVQ